MIYLLFPVMTLASSLGAYFFKKSGGIGTDLKRMLTNIPLITGGVLYLFAAFINIYLLRYLKYGVVVPLSSISYIWTIVISRVALKEEIGVNKLIGVGLIMAGVFFISYFS